MRHIRSINEHRLKIEQGIDAEALTLWHGFDILEQANHVVCAKERDQLFMDTNGFMNEPTRRSINALSISFQGAQVDTRESRHKKNGIHGVCMRHVPRSHIL
jgi:hypothetical protein